MYIIKEILSHIHDLKGVMYMCKDKEEKDILEMLLKPKEKQSAPKTAKIPNESIEKLVRGKTPIVCKDGVVKIDSDHPDYKYWMED